MRVHITGNAGSGKTTLACELGKILGFNVYGLDRIVWGENWSLTPSEERKVLESELVAKSEWIIEGVSSTARQAADIIIFLDLPRYVCFKRCIIRTLRFFFSTRPELPVNCPEFKIFPRLIKIIWQFPLVAKQKILSDIGKEQGIIITNSDELCQFLEEIRRNKCIMCDHKAFTLG